MHQGLIWRLKVAHVWRGKFGVVSAIFLVNRYLVPWILFVDAYEFLCLSESSSLVFCKTWTILQGYCTVSSYLSAHVLVAMRVYAIYGGRRWIRIVLWTAGTILTVSGLILCTVGLVATIAAMQPDDIVCVSIIPSYLWTAYLPSVIFETVLFALTMHVAVSRMSAREDISDLLLTLFRDGILYFLAVSVCTLFSLLIWALAPHPYISLARNFSLAMINVAASRLVLNLKVYASAASRSHEPEEHIVLVPVARTVISAMHFKSGAYLKSASYVASRDGSGNIIGLAL